MLELFSAWIPNIFPLRKSLFCGHIQRYVGWYSDLIHLRIRVPAGLSQRAAGMNSLGQGVLEPPLTATETLQWVCNCALLHQGFVSLRWAHYMLLSKTTWYPISQHCLSPSSTQHHHDNVLNWSYILLAGYFFVYFPFLFHSSNSEISLLEPPEPLGATGESSFSLHQETSMSFQCSPMVHQPLLPGLSSWRAAVRPGRAFPHVVLSGDCLTVVSGFCVRTRRREGTEGPHLRRAEQLEEGGLDQSWDLWVRSCWPARIWGLRRQVSIKALK